MFKYLLTVLLVCSGSANYATAQTCSCAKVPVGSSLERPTTEAGVWQFGLTYEYHPIADIYIGSEELKNDSRTRTSHTALFDISVGLTRQLSVSTQMTFTQQERESTALLGSGESLRTRGIGDGLLLLKYNVIMPSGGSRLQAAIGGGIKVPFGTSSLANNGTLISADMQPGSGSWDGLFWTYLNQGLDDQNELAVYSTTSFRYNGSADRGGTFPKGYRSGHELVSNLGISRRQSERFDLLLGVLVRHASTDQAGSQTVPNTGGIWVNLVPMVNYNWSPALTIRVGGQAPIYRNVQGVQATTSYTLSLALFYSPAKQEKFGIQR